MTLTTFVRKSAFRNKRRSILTMISIAFSLMLLTFMMTVWRAFYLDQGSEQSTQRLITRHRVSLTFPLPIYYEQKMKTVPGVVAVVPTQWFGGRYIDDKPEHFFAQFATDPQEFFNVYTDFKIPPDELSAWQHDRAGAVADSDLAKKFGWKVGDRCADGSRGYRRHVSQFTPANENREREGLRARLRGHAGQCEGIHPEHLRSGRVCHTVGFG